MQHTPGEAGDGSSSAHEPGQVGGDEHFPPSHLFLMEGGYAAQSGDAGDPAAALPDMTQLPLPPLNIIASCKTLGFFKPLDCFWSEVKPGSDHYMQGQVPCACAEFRRIGSRWSGLRASGTINVFIHRCLFNEKDSASIYRMGQCPACNTIYWSCEDAPLQQSQQDQRHRQQAA